MTENAPGDEAKGRSGRWRPLALIAFVIAMTILAKVLGLGKQVADLREWIEALGAWGPVVFLVLYVAASVAALPGSLFSIAGGALFGSFWGVVLVSIGSTGGASLAFLVGRYFARDATVRWLSNNEKFRRLDRLTEEHGATVVALTRLVPILPFNLLNYGFGLTRIPFWTYVFWSWLCMLPVTVLYVVGTDTLARGISQGDTPMELLLILAVTALIMLLLIRYTRRKLRAAGASSSEGRPQQGS